MRLMNKDFVSRRDVLQGSASALAAATSGLVLSACGDAPAPAAGQTALTFLAVVPLTTLTYAPELLADAGGYFAERGLDVSFQSTRGTAQAIQLVLAGSAPLTRIGQIEAVSHITNRGAPIVNVGTVVKKSTIRFVSSAQNPLLAPADFVGKTMGIPSEGGESETTLDLLLSSSGIDPERVERQVVGVGPGVFNLVEQGRIAGFIVSIDTAKIIQQQMPNAVVLNPGEFIESGAQLYMASREHLEENRELIRNYLSAIDAALKFMIDDDGFDETLSIIRQRYSFATLEDATVAKASLGEYVRVWTAEGRDNILRTEASSWRRGYAELVESGLVADGFDPSEWFTNELLPRR